jgi:hypothetical protein
MQDQDGHFQAGRGGGRAEEVELELSPEERASYKLIRAELHLMMRQKRWRRERDSVHTPRHGVGHVGEAAAPLVASEALSQPQRATFSPQV